MAEIGFFMLLGGLISYFVPTKLLFIILVTALILILAAFIFSPRKKTNYILIILFFLMGTIIFKVNYRSIENADNYVNAKHTYTAEITSISNNKKRNFYKANIISIDNKEIKENYGITFSSENNYDKFDIVKLKSYIYKSYDDSFLSESHRTSKRLVFFTNNIEEECKIGEKSRPFIRKVDKFKDVIYNRIDSLYDKESSIILKGIILGDISDIDDSLYFNIKRTGLSHLFAASGFNLSVFVGFVLFLLSLFNAKRKTKSFIGIFVVIFFSALSGFSPSILRAGFMYIVLLLSMIFDEKTDTLNSLGVAVLILYLLNPLICINISFLLSVSAILGIVIISEPLNHYSSKMIKIKNSVIRKLLIAALQMLLVGLGACVATTPVLLMFFKNISLLSPVTSILFIYPVQFIFIGGIISILIPYPLSKLVNFVIKELIHLINFISSLNIGTINFNPFFTTICLTICLSIMILCVIKPKKKTIKKTASLLLCTFILLIFLVTSLLSINRLSLSFIDVGQGDSILLKYNGQNILFDAGGTKSYQNITDTLNDTTIDYIVVSHYHKDHINYIDDLQQIVKVKTIIAPPAENEKEEEILNNFKKYSDVIIASNDVTMENEDLCINIFTHHAVFEDGNANDGSLISLIKYKDFSALITGDLEYNGERNFLNEYCGKNLDVDVLKVGHHGSNTSSSKPFLNKVKPEVSVISVGKNNQYNHPEQPLLERLYACDSKVYRTDKDKTVTVMTYGKEYYVH